MVSLLMEGKVPIPKHLFGLLSEEKIVWLATDVFENIQLMLKREEESFSPVYIGLLLLALKPLLWPGSRLESPNLPPV